MSRAYIFCQFLPLLEEIIWIVRRIFKVIWGSSTLINISLLGEDKIGDIPGS